MQNEINAEWIYPQSPEQIWAYLTQSELIALWLMPNDFEPILGKEFQFKINPIPSLDLDGIFYCKILEILPFQKLTYSWKGGSGDGIFTLDTVVEWTLSVQENGTKLTLKQSGFKETNFTIFTGMTDGWQKNIEKMMVHLNKGKNGNP